MTASSHNNWSGGRLSLRLATMLAIGLFMVGLAGCGSSSGSSSGQDRSQAIEQSASDTDSPTSLPDAYESSAGPASLLVVMSSVLPTADELGPGWNPSFLPPIDLAAACEIIASQAVTNTNFANVSLDSITPQELGFGIVLFETEADAAARIAWLNSPASAACDEAYGPQAAELVERSSAGAYTLDPADWVGVSSDLSHVPVGAGAAASRVYALTFLGGAGNLELVADVAEVQVGRFVVRYERSGSAGEPLSVDGSTVLDRMVSDLATLENALEGDLAVDAVGEALRRSVPIGLVPERFDVSNQAAIAGPQDDSSCEEPPADDVRVGLDGPLWLARQARAIEQLAYAVEVFTSPSAAQSYFEHVLAEGADCMAELELWPTPTFAQQQYSARLVEVNGVEVIELRATAVQPVADLDVEVEAIIRIGRDEEFLITVQYAGLAGDGDFTEEILSEALTRVRR